MTRYTKIPLLVHSLDVLLKKRSPRIIRILASPFYEVLRYISLVSTKITIETFTQLGADIKLSSLGGIIIGAREVGDNTKIHHNVTIGRGLGVHIGQPFPTIGKNVWIGPNTVISGGIVVGDGSTILGGTILTRSIPVKSLVSGNPPRVISRNADNAGLLQCDDSEVSLDNYQGWIK